MAVPKMVLRPCGEYAVNCHAVVPGGTDICIVEGCVTETVEAVLYGSCTGLVHSDMYNAFFHEQILGGMYGQGVSIAALIEPNREILAPQSQIGRIIGVPHQFVTPSGLHVEDFTLKTLLLFRTVFGSARKRFVMV